MIFIEKNFFEKIYFAAKIKIISYFCAKFINLNFLCTQKGKLCLMKTRQNIFFE